ncbi:MAG: O-antigen ligase family protein, partial [Candidatus Helarchaeota archaeon]
TISLPEKFALLPTIGLIIAPLIFVIPFKEKILIGLFIFSLGVEVGVKLIERRETTASIVKVLFQLYISDLLLLILLFILILKIYTHRDEFRFSIWNSKITIFFVLWIMMGFFSMIPAIDRTAVAIGIIRWIRIFIIYFVIFHFVKDREATNFILKCFLLVLLLQSLLMLLQAVTGSVVLDLPGTRMGLDIAGNINRPSGTLGHSSHYAKFCGLVISVALAYIFFAQKFRWKVFMIAVWLFGSVALVLTVSRIGLFSWFLSVIIFFMGIIFFNIVLTYKRRGVLFFGLTLTTLSLILIVLTGGTRLKSRMMEDYGSAEVRVPMFRVAVNIIKAHPLIGVGLNNYTLVHHYYDDTRQRISIIFPAPVHNLFLLYAAEIGIIGLIFFLMFMGKMIKTSFYCIKKANLRIDKAVYLCMSIGVINILMQSMTGMGVVDRIIHLSTIGVFAGILAKQELILKVKNSSKNKTRRCKDNFNNGLWKKSIFNS